MNNPIGWCDITINPFVGCSKCSPGCDNCYAERFAARMAKNPATTKKYAGVVNESGEWTGGISELDMTCFDKLPKKPCRVFVGSMTDFFHKNADFDDQGKVLNRIAHTEQHTFLLLTKRPENAWKRYHTMLPNVWLGVTVCNQEEADAKIPVLLDIPAAKRFVSIEPMLGPVDLTHHFFSEPTGKFRTKNGKRQMECVTPPDGAISWVICGGETGLGARPMHPDWARSLRDQCAAAGVPFYFKGWGGSGKKSAPLLDGREWHQFPEVSNA